MAVPSTDTGNESRCQWIMITYLKVAVLHVAVHCQCHNQPLYGRIACFGGASVCRLLDRARTALLRCCRSPCGAHCLREASFRSFVVCIILLSSAAQQARDLAPMLRFTVTGRRHQEGRQWCWCWGVRQRTPNGQKWSALATSRH